MFRHIETFAITNFVNH